MDEVNVASVLVPYTLGLAPPGGINYLSIYLIILYRNVCVTKRTLKKAYPSIYICRLIVRSDD